MPKIQRGSDAPDSIRPHLLQIAERLWNDRAVVMVGAGFSKNASAAYPNWAQLGDVLYEKAYGKKPEQADKTYLSLLKVAEEAESVIGRSALDALLQQHIPNDNVDPSELHERLLSLPWVDVLTTNYDTLLERAQRKVVNRRYTPVLEQHDLPYAEKPRIIKLHGSFPGHRPFVITEEDYRQYPEKRAPFVNTVRQALLENTLCLIGFSGDDPNFLQWVGWIRDQMGTQHTQPIYLITCGSFPVSQQLLLAKRQIIVVDLAQFQGAMPGDHASALRKFFNFIDTQDPYRLDWPTKNGHFSPTAFSPTIEDLENVTAHWHSQRLSYPGWLVLSHMKRSILFTWTRSWISPSVTDEIKNLNDGLDIRFLFELTWRIERCLLPLIDLYPRIEAILGKYWPFAEAQTSQKSEICYSDVCFNYLDWHGIREAWVSLACALLRCYREENLSDKWMGLQVRLEGLKNYVSDEQREFLCYQTYLFHLFQLDINKARIALINWNPGISNPYWQNIRCAAAAELGQVDNLSIKNTFVSVQEGLQQALFETRVQAQTIKDKAFYQADSYEAYQMVFVHLLPNALRAYNQTIATADDESQMREQFIKDWLPKHKTILNPDVDLQSSNKKVSSDNLLSFFTANDDWNDLSLKQQCSRNQEWLTLLRIIREQNSTQEIKRRNKRWDQLKAVGCDPWAELKFFELALTKPIEKNTPGVTVQSTFDLGRINRSESLDGDDVDALNAYAFLRFCEDIGLPFLVRNTVMAKDSTMAALPRIAQYSQSWALVSLFRLGETKAIDSLFDREAVNKLTVEQCDQLILHYLKVLLDTAPGLSTGYGETHVFEGRLAKLLPEVISRLCCKCSFDTKSQMLSFIEKVYSSKAKPRYEGVRNLVVRLFNSMSDNEKKQQIPAMLQIQRPADVGIREEREFPPPISLINFLVKPKNACEVVAGCKLPIANLLQDMTSGNEDTQNWAVATLIPLAQWNMLTETQTQQLSNAYWQGKGMAESMQNDVYYRFVFLMLSPHNAVHGAQFKNYVKQQCNSIRPNGEQKILARRDTNTMIREILGAAQIKNFWNMRDARQILGFVVTTWDADKRHLKKSPAQETTRPDFFDRTNEFHRQLQIFTELISFVLAPALVRRTSVKTKAELARVLNEMQRAGLHTLEAQVACSHFITVPSDVLLTQISQAFHRNEKMAEVDALKAILLIAKKQDEALWPQAAELLAQFIQWNRTDQLSWALWVVIRLLKLKDSPSSLLPTLLDATISRLERLIEESDYQNGNLIIDFNHKIELRKIAVMLASELLPTIPEADQRTLNILKQWREICELNEEFAEVRHAWIGA